MSDLSPSDWLDQPVRITRDGVFFGEHQLLGVIAENGVAVHYDVDGTSINKLTVEFLVGAVVVDDPHVTQSTTYPVVRFGVRRTDSEQTNG
jgi:hypothetical protein